MSRDLILFVEDNADFRDSSARFLELSNYEVMVAGDGIEALEILKNSPRSPDVIISDISMPNMNGYELFERVRSRAEYTDIPFIFLTALDARDDFKQGWDVGVDEYLVKPFRPADFLSVIRNRLNRTRAIRQHAADQLNETRNMIVRILSHELRTPLTYVTGGFTLLADQINKGESTAELAVDPDEIQTILHLIHSGTDRLNRLAEQMVMLAELMSSQSSKSWDHLQAKVDINQVIGEVVHNMNQLAETQKVKIEVEAADLIIDGIENLIVAAITEPLRNALQYSAPGQTVFVRAYPDPADELYIIIEVEDTGRGIPREDLDNIWQLMEQAERQKFEQQGFGLGLPITQRILQLHRGRTQIKSIVDKGTTVRLYFPVQSEHNDHSSNDASSSSGANGASQYIH